MIVDDVSRSVRGVAGFLNRSPDALRQFEVSVPAFRRSFGAIALTAPGFVVELALLRRSLGLPPEVGLLSEPGLAFMAGTAHVLAFLALPASAALLLPRIGLAHRFGAFAITMNWLAALASLPLALPGALLLLGCETDALVTLFGIAFSAAVLCVQWRAVRSVLGLGGLDAAAICGLGVLLTGGLGRVLQLAAAALVGSAG